MAQGYISLSAPRPPLSPPLGPTRQQRSAPLSRARSSSDKWAPPVSPFSLPVTSPAQSPMTTTLPLSHRNYSCASEVRNRSAPSSLCSHPFTAPRFEPFHPRRYAPSSPPLCTSPMPAGFRPFPSPGAYKRDRPSSTSPHTGLGHSPSLPPDSIKLGVATSLCSGELSLLSPVA
jgi:hypothetical protein